MDDMELLEMLEEDTFYTEDGCHVEADGICPHGFKSPLLLAGMI
jgi:hypothetical protein